MLRFHKVKASVKYRLWRPNSPLWRCWYSFPNIVRPRVPLSPKGETWLDTLRRDGIVRIEEDKFQECASYLAETYFAKLERPDGSLQAELHNAGLFVIDINTPEYREGGTEINSVISFKDSTLAALFFDPTLNGVVYNYYRRQPYFRKQPLIQKISYADEKKMLSNSQFHVDRLHQVTIMLLVSDVTENDTHMQYAIGSHRVGLPPGVYPDAVDRYGCAVFECIGKAGTLFLFDAMGAHRAKYLAGAPRRILHLIFTTGHDITREGYDTLSPWPTLASYPTYSRRMVLKITR